MSETKLTKAAVEILYLEKEAINNWLSPPPPDPEQWPPVGWQEWPVGSGSYFRQLTEAQLREELFGSPEKDGYIAQAKARLAEINAALCAHFFPKPKEEGTQRKTLSGFVALLKTGLKRTIDEAALPDVLDNVPKGTEDKVIKWKPSLMLKEFRELPKKTRDGLEAAFVVTPEKPIFEIVKKP